MYTSSYKQSSQIFTNFDFAANCQETTNLWSVVLGTILRTIFKVTASVLFGMDGFEESPSCFWPLWESAATAKQRGAVRVPDGVRGGAVAGGDSVVFRFLRAVLVLLVVVGCGYLALDAAKLEGLKEDPQGHRRLRVAARTYRRGRCSTVAGRKGTSQRPFFSTLDTIVE